VGGFALALAMAFAFAVTNGLHDAANAIATLVATRAARPLPAVLMAAVFNLIGPLLVGAAVADTIATIVDVPPSQEIAVIGAGLTGAVTWNVLTWLRGLPSSSRIGSAHCRRLRTQASTCRYWPRRKRDWESAGPPCSKKGAGGIWSRCFAGPPRPRRTRSEANSRCRRLRTA
jgi:hypothetical protein